MISQINVFWRIERLGFSHLTLALDQAGGAKMILADLCLSVTGRFFLELI